MSWSAQQRFGSCRQASPKHENRSFCTFFSLTHIVWNQTRASWPFSETFEHFAAKVCLALSSLWFKTHNIYCTLVRRSHIDTEIDHRTTFLTQTASYRFNRAPPTSTSRASDAGRSRLAFLYLFCVSDAHDAASVFAPRFHKNTRAGQVLTSISQFTSLEFHRELRTGVQRSSDVRHSRFAFHRAFCVLKRTSPLHFLRTDLTEQNNRSLNPLSSSTHITSVETRAFYLYSRILRRSAFKICVFSSFLVLKRTASHLFLHKCPT